MHDNTCIDNEEKSLMEGLDALDLTQIESDPQNSALLQKSAKEFIKRNETKRSAWGRRTEFRR